MRPFLRCLAFILVSYSLAAHAHLMVAQRGTLKFGKGGYFFVVSIPISALTGIDDDGDGLLSAHELRDHRNRIEKAVSADFKLTSDKYGPRPIEGLLLNMAHNHGSLQKPSTHIVAMGRFAVSKEEQKLRLETTLFGKTIAEQKLVFKVSRGAQQEHLELSKQKNSRVLFSTL